MLPDKKKTQFTEISPYNAFARHYDRFMEHVPYHVWAAYLWQRACQLRGSSPANLLDFGCGTGQILAFMLPHNLDIVGVDASAAMLKQARELIQDATFIQADLQGPIALAASSRDWLISSHDCLNYLLSTQELASHFKEAVRLMRDEAIYSADFVSLDNIRRHFAGQTRVHRMGMMRLVWSNRYDENRQQLISRLDFKNRSGLIQREEHTQQYYSRHTIKEVAWQAGLETIMIEADYRKGPPRPEVSFYNFHFRKR